MKGMALCLREELISGGLAFCLLIVAFSTKLLRELQIWDLITSFFIKIRKEQQN